MTLTRKYTDSGIRGHLYISISADNDFVVYLKNLARLSIRVGYANLRAVVKEWEGTDPRWNGQFYVLRKTYALLSRLSCYSYETTLNVAHMPKARKQIQEKHVPPYRSHVSLQYFRTLAT